MYMSAIKTHDVYSVVHGDDILIANEEGDKRFKVTSLLVDRQRPSVCQIFAESEHKGSFPSSDTKAWNCKVVSTEPDKNSVTFNVKAIVGKESQELALTSVKSQNSECIIC